MGAAPPPAAWTIEADKAPSPKPARRPAPTRDTPAPPARWSAPVCETLFQAATPVRCVALMGSDDGLRSRAIIGCNAHRLRVLSWTPGADPRPRVDCELPEAHKGSVYCLDYLRGRRLAASGSNDKSIRLTRHVLPGCLSV